MRFFALATDYDGTIATGGVVDAETVSALERFVASGRRLVLVTGRQLDDLARVFPRLDLFERVVGENGGVLYTPSTRQLRVLAEPPPESFVRLLRARGVEPVSVGRVVVATWEPHGTAVLEAIRELGLELHVEFNKGAVMVLPAAVTKRSGLDAALAEMKLSQHNVVGAGDAENDQAFLSACECAVAVANALPLLKARADWVTPGARGAGVTELVDRILADDLASLRPALARHRIPVGRASDGTMVGIEPYGETVLVAGPSGSGKTTIAAALIERLVDAGYQLCVVDPEGDHDELEGAAAVGASEHAPAVQEVERLLDDPRRTVVASLVAVPMEERPGWFAALLVRLEELRARSGRPHWIVADEAHHVVPAARDPSTPAVAARMGELLLVTAHPETVAPRVMDQVDVRITTVKHGVARVQRTGGPEVVVEVIPARQEQALRSERARRS